MEKIEIDTNRIYFEELAKLMMKYLAENHNPHTRVIIDCNSAELLSGEICINITKN